MRTQRGFTYVELMIVMTIIATLAAIAVPNFLEAQVRAAVSRSRADLASIRMGIDAYRLEHRAFPLNAETGVSSPGDLTPLTTPIAYITQLPLDVFSTSDVRSERHVRPMPPQGYKYLNGMQFDPENWFSLDAESALAPNFPRTRIPIFIWGLGPRESLNVDAQPPYVTLSPSGQLSLRSYNPTNGTTSAGSLFLFGR